MSSLIFRDMVKALLICYAIGLIMTLIILIYPDVQYQDYSDLKSQIVCSILWPIVVWMSVFSDA